MPMVLMLVVLIPLDRDDHIRVMLLHRDEVGSLKS